MVPIEWIQINDSKKEKNVLSKLDSEEKKHILNALKQEEAVESSETPIQLESENYKIDADMSREEKLKNGWTKKNVKYFFFPEDWSNEEPYWNNSFLEWEMEVLIKKLTYGANVLEFQNTSIVPKKLVWEQLFNWKSVIELDLYNKLPNIKQVKKMSELFWDYQELFKKQWEFIFPGEFKVEPNSWECWLWLMENSGEFWTAQWIPMVLNKDNIYVDDDCESSLMDYYSLRLLKK